MNQTSEKLMDMIFNDDSFFLSVIDADSPAELKQISLSYIKSSDDIGSFDVTSIEWKRIYQELKDINDPINIQV